MNVPKRAGLKGFRIAFISFRAGARFPGAECARGLLAIPGEGLLHQTGAFWVKDLCSILGSCPGTAVMSPTVAGRPNRA